MAILSGRYVLEYTDGSASLCLKTLKDMGAVIVRVNPERAPQHFRYVVKNASVFIETAPPGKLASFGFDYEKLAGINPRLIMVSITPFGQTGLDKALQASDLTLQAAGGWLSVTGTPEQPLKLPGEQAYHTASLFALNGILLALGGLAETGKGCYLDVPVQACVAAALDHVPVRYFYEDVISGREGSRIWNNAFDILPCKDGYILISIHRQWETLVELLKADGLAADLADLKWQDRETRNKHIGHITEVLQRWTLQHTALELEELGQLMHFPWAAVR
jgi:benzylsuccinate CoA-transferase BbsE subunit